MKALVISDTHGYAAILEKVLEKEQDIDILIHCGDVEGEEKYIRDLVHVPCYFVGGNMDAGSGLNKEITIKLDDCRCFITHGHWYGVSIAYDHLVDEAMSRKADIVLCGHTHKPVLKTFGRLTLMNPGSLALPRQMGRKKTYGIIQFDREHEPHFFIREI